MSQSTPSNTTAPKSRSYAVLSPKFLLLTPAECEVVEALKKIDIEHEIRRRFLRDNSSRQEDERAWNLLIRRSQNDEMEAHEEMLRFNSSDEKYHQYHLARRKAELKKWLEETSGVVKQIIAAPVQKWEAAAREALAKYEPTQSAAAEARDALAELTGSAAPTVKHAGEDKLMAVVSSCRDALSSMKPDLVALSLPSMWERFSNFLVEA